MEPKLSSTKEVDWMLKEWQKCPVELGSCIEEYMEGYFYRVKNASRSGVVLRNMKFRLSTNEDNKCNGDITIDKMPHAMGVDVVMEYAKNTTGARYMGLQPIFRKYGLTDAGHIQYYSIATMDNTLVIMDDCDYVDNDNDYNCVFVKFIPLNQLDHWKEDPNDRYNYVVEGGNLDPDWEMDRVENELHLKIPTTCLLNKEIHMGTVAINCSFAECICDKSNGDMRFRYFSRDSSKGTKLVLLCKNGEFEVKSNGRCRNIRAAIHIDEKNDMFVLCVLTGRSVCLIYGRDGKLVHYRKISSEAYEGAHFSYIDYPFGVFRIQGDMEDRWICLEGSLLD